LGQVKLEAEFCIIAYIFPFHRLIKSLSGCVVQIFLVLFWMCELAFVNVLLIFGLDYLEY